MTTMIDTVPETDAELEAKLEASVKRAKPARARKAPANKPPAGKPAAKTPAKPKPEVDPNAQAQAVLAELNLPFTVEVTGQAAWAPFKERVDIVAIMWQLRTDGWERPAISALTGFNDSTVYRAQRGRTHVTEVDAWLDFFAKVADGTHKPPVGKGRKRSVELVQARVVEAIEVLGNEAKTVAQYRKLTEAALEILRDVAPEAAAELEATDEATASA